MVFVTKAHQPAVHLDKGPSATPDGLGAGPYCGVGIAWWGSLVWIRRVLAAEGISCCGWGPATGATTGTAPNRSPASEGLGKKDEATGR